MVDASPLREGLTNTLWLLGHAAADLITQAHNATAELDDLIRQALQDTTDSDAVAHCSFLNPDLIRHVQDGGSTLEYFLRDGSRTAGHPEKPSL